MSKLTYKQIMKMAEGITDEVIEKVIEEMGLSYSDNGLHATDKNDPNKQIKLSHNGAENVALITKDNWETFNVVRTGDKEWVKWNENL